MGKGRQGRGHDLPGEEKEEAREQWCWAGELCPGAGTPFPGRAPADPGWPSGRPLLGFFPALRLYEMLTYFQNQFSSLAHFGFRPNCDCK